VGTVVLSRPCSARSASTASITRTAPLANSCALAALIPGAKLTLYPGAGHAFLFQDQAAFARLIESFLGRAGSQLP
jgi:pimeloyl-ACP methyl ester carboxylesterase